MTGRLPSLTSVFAASALVNFANAVLTTALPVYLADSLENSHHASLLASAYSAGFLVGCIYGPRLILAFGHVRAFASGGSALAILILAFTLKTDAFLWIALRILSGFAVAIMLSAADSWINASTASQNRGHILGCYGVVLSASFVLSQYAVYSFDSARLMLGLLLVAAVNVAVLCLSLTTSVLPSVPQAVRLQLSHHLKQSPSAGLGYMVCGALTSIVLGVMPYFLHVKGIPTKMVAVAVASVYFGRLLMQWPIGKLSDKVDRRLVLTSVSSAAGLLTLGIWILSPGEGQMIGGQLGAGAQIFALAGLFVWGGCAFSIYSIAVAHGLDKARDDEVVGATTTALLTFAGGAVVGPLISALATKLLGDNSVSLLLTVIALLYAALVAYRYLNTGGLEETKEAIAYDVPQTSLNLSEVVADPERQAK